MEDDTDTLLLMVYICYMGRNDELRGNGLKRMRFLIEARTAYV